MKKLAVVLVVSLFAVACSSTMTTGTGSTGVPGAPAVKFEATHFRLLNEPNAVREFDVLKPPRGLHVKGQMTRDAFYWANQVDGNGQFCPEGKDWVTLGDGLFHSASSGETPKAPYVLGCKAKNGLFIPASRDVVMQ
jgi:hypothetical protein